MNRYKALEHYNIINFKKDEHTPDKIVSAEDACDRLNDLERRFVELNKCHKQYKIECNKIIKAKNDLISLQESEIIKRKEVRELNEKLIAKLYAVILFLVLFLFPCVMFYAL